MLILTNLQKKVLELRDEKCMTFREIGNTLGCSKQSVNQAYISAKRKLPNMDTPLKIRLSEKFSSIVEAAKAIGISQQTLNNKLNGITKFNTAEAMKIMKLLDIEFSEMPKYFEGEDEEK